MKIDKIKPIPKYIIALIRKYDNTHCHYPTNSTRYYAYLTKNDGELVKVTVAVKNYYKQWHCKQVAVHGLHSKDCFLKDIAFNRIGGYITGWYAEGINKFRKWYEDGKWGEQDDRMFDMEAPVVNMDYLKRYPEYKYSQIENYTGDRVLQYLRLYEQYPQMEYLMKLGLNNLAMSHCVGGENYRLKMSKGKTLIFFVRKADEPDKAYITLEYSPTGKNILQCYAYDNTPPEKSALEFVKNKWLPYANDTVNKIKRRKAA